MTYRNVVLWGIAFDGFRRVWVGKLTKAGFDQRGSASFPESVNPKKVNKKGEGRSSPQEWVREEQSSFSEEAEVEESVVPCQNEILTEMAQGYEI